jgi:hypothetical protein
MSLGLASLLLGAGLERRQLGQDLLANALARSVNVLGQ